MRYLNKIARTMGRIVAECSWWGLGLWATLAIFFTAPGPGWLGYVLAMAVAALFVMARRESFRFHRWKQVPWPEKKLTSFALLAVSIVLVYYIGFVTPNPNEIWSTEQSRMPIVTFDGDKVHVRNVRNFTWHSPTDYSVGFYDRTYDLSKLNSMYYVVASMAHWEGVAHVFVSFGFSDGQHVAVSVEGRRVKGRPYRVIASMFRQYQMIYIIGDERDVIGLRGAVWRDPVYFYPATTTDERKRWIFRDMMERAHSLEDHPEFYHLIFNNCMNNITYHLRRLGGRPLPHDLQLLLTGLSDRAAHRLGYIDTELPFEKARQAFRVDLWMRDSPLDETFSRRMRETVRRQEAEAMASMK